MAVLAAVALLAACTDGNTGGPCTVTQAAAFDITYQHGLLFVPVTINGGTYHALLDTGAERSAIADPLAKRLQLPEDNRHGTVMSGVGGMGKERQDVIVGQFAFAGHDLGNNHYAIMDQPKLLTGVPDFAGLIGGDVLDDFDLDIDVPHRRLTAWRVHNCTGKFLPWTFPYTAIPLDVTWGHRPNLTVKVDGTKFRAFLDTGATATFLDSAAAARVGVNAAALGKDPNGRASGAAGVDFTSTVHKFSTLEIGPDIFANPHLTVLDRTLREADMLLGEDYLRLRHVWLSYHSRQLFVAAPPH